MENVLGLKHVSLCELKPGESCIVGPYDSPKTVSSMISRARKKLPADADFAQWQMILSAPDTGRCYKMYIVTRKK